MSTTEKEAAEISRLSEKMRQRLQRRQERRKGQQLLSLLPQGHGSGLNADLLDGKHAADIIKAAFDKLELELRKFQLVGRGGGGTQGVVDHGELLGLGDDDHSLYALADKSRPNPWVAETDVPVLTDAKYPNAVLRDGTRKMTGDLDLDGNDIKTVSYLEIDWAIRSLYDGFADLGEADSRFRMAYINDSIHMKPHSVGITWEWDTTSFLRIRVYSEILQWLIRVGGGGIIAVFDANYALKRMRTYFDFTPMTNKGSDLGTSSLWWNVGRISELQIETVNSDLPMADDKFIQVGKDSDASLPTASASYRGKMIRVEGGSGVADHVYICLKEADDSYSWHQLD